MMKPWMRWLLPIGVLLGAAGMTVGLIRTRKPEVPDPVPNRPPVVRAAQPVHDTHRYRVRAQGVVQPAVEITLSAEVAGRVTSVAPGFAVGGFFEAGQVLVQLDPRDHELALDRARAGLAEAEVRLQREEAEAAAARREWEAIRRDTAPSPLVARLPQLAEARAGVAAAHAGVRLAELDLERCTLRAPFAGRVREKSVDVGQFVTRAQVVARLYSIEAAEVRLSLSLVDLGYLDLDLGRRAAPNATDGPSVRLEAQLGQDTGSWMGRIVRTEGEVDPRTRMVTAVVRVNDPYGPQAGVTPSGPPLAVGMFVTAEIQGREAGRVWRVDRTAMRGENRLLVVDAGDRLRIRTVTLLRMEGDTAILAAGLEPGDRICLSPLATPVDGMRVEVVTDAASAILPDRKAYRD